jgi:putative flippase GtrA
VRIPFAYLNRWPLSFRELHFARTTSTAVQFIRYVYVGTIAAIADISILYMLTEFIGIHYLVSAALAFMAGVVINYTLCTLWIFPGTRFNTAKGFTLFLVIGIVGLALNEIIIYSLVDFVGVWYMLAKVVSTVIVLFWNFFARKKLVFA